MFEGMGQVHSSIKLLAKMQASRDVEADQTLGSSEPRPREAKRDGNRGHAVPLGSLNADPCRKGYICPLALWSPFSSLACVDTSHPVRRHLEQVYLFLPCLLRMNYFSWE